MFGCTGVPFLECVDLLHQASSDEPADRQILKPVFTVHGFLQEIVIKKVLRYLTHPVSGLM